MCFCNSITTENGVTKPARKPPLTGLRSSPFQNCLGILYATVIDSLDSELEALVGNILGCVQVRSACVRERRRRLTMGRAGAMNDPCSIPEQCRVL